MAESITDKFDRWKNRIEVSKKYMDDLAPEWEKYRKAYEGDETQLYHESTRSSHYDLMSTINWTYLDVRSSVPRLYAQTPQMNIDPETPEADLYAEIVEKVVNVLKDKRWKLGDRMRDLVKGSKLSGRDYLKVYYNFEKDDVKNIGTNFEGERFNDEIMIDWVSRESILTPTDMVSFNSARWVAHEIKIPWKEGLKKFNLKEEDRPFKDTKRNDYVDDLPENQKEDFQYMVYYEIEDRVNRELPIIVKGIDRFVVKPYEFPYPYYSMYIPLEWNNIPGRGDTKADPHFWWAMQEELSETKSRQLHHARKLNAKYIVRGAKPLSERQKQALRSSVDSEVVELDPNQDFIPFSHATLGQEVYLLDQTTRQDLGVVSGINEIKQGRPQKKKTAREAVLIAEEAQSLAVDRATEVEKVLEKAVMKCVLLMQKFYDRTRVIRLTGMEEVEFVNLKDRIGEKLKDEAPDLLQGSAERPFIKFIGKKMKGEMSVRVSSGSTLPQDEESRKQDMALLLQLAGQFPPLAARIDPDELLKEITKLLHFQNKNVIVDANTPEQENVLLKRGIPVMPQLNENHLQHIQVHMMESNNTPEFLNHILGHRLFMNQLQSVQAQNVQMQQEQPNTLNDLAREGIPGTPQGEQASQEPPTVSPAQPPQGNPGQ